ncbi:MAG: hypothetical protein ACFE8P_17100, partial [Promethearchaeota archaeon]
ECFYRLFRTVKIRTGRKALSEARMYSYDPIITIGDETIYFETFSNDMTSYAFLCLNAEAFKNIQEWEPGMTNVDFTPDFINGLRKAGAKSVKSLYVDPNGFGVDTNEETLVEKKVDLPENWNIALDNMRGFVNPDKISEDLADVQNFVRRSVFGPFCNQRYAKIDSGWIPKDGWSFARLNLRKDLGHMIYGNTSAPTERFDGRQNPKYQAIRSKRMLRQLKSYLLEVKHLAHGLWEVTGSGRVRRVSKKSYYYECDCEDYKYRGKWNPEHRCKHIRAVIRPKIDLRNVGQDKWEAFEIYDNKKYQGKVNVEFKDLKFTCSCDEFKSTNICLHVIEVMKSEKDFQFDELKQDLTSQK